MVLFCWQRHNSCLHLQDKKFPNLFQSVTKPLVTSNNSSKAGHCPPVSSLFRRKFHKNIAKILQVLVFREEITYVVKVLEHEANAILKVKMKSTDKMATFVLMVIRIFSCYSKKMT